MISEFISTRTISFDQILTTVNLLEFDFVLISDVTGVKMDGNFDCPVPSTTKVHSESYQSVISIKTYI
jgi:hypothetical protein